MDKKPEFISKEISKDAEQDMKEMFKCFGGQYCGSMDFNTQFRAIHDLLGHSKIFIKKMDEQIKVAEKRHDGSEYADINLNDSYYDSVYLDAAYSMAAVGQLAPLLESLMTDYFTQLGKKYSDNKFKSNRFNNVSEQSWNPHYVFGKEAIREDFCDGLEQLIKDLDIESKLPKNTVKIFRALMIYRNKMFHNGLEWPEKQRKRFADFIRQEKIEEWFSCSRISNRPWIYYMEDAFIEECLKLTKLLIENLGHIEPKICKTK
jgi:hypothetical protein